MLISDAWSVCKKCSNKGKGGCKVADFQSGKREEYKHPLPKCITEASGKATTKTIKQNGEQKTLLDVKPERTVDVSWVWDRLDSKIIEAILNKYNVNGIIRIVGGKKGTVQYRIKRMEKEGLILGYETQIGGKKKLFNLTAKCRKLLNKPEKEPQRQVQTGTATPSPHPFTSHANALIFGILEGEPPTSSHPYKMNNWTGHIFDSMDGSHSIRTTPKSIIVYVNIEIGNHSVINLIIKFAELGKTIAGKFAERHKLKLGEPEAYRDPHFTLKNNALARIITEVGNFTSDSGISFDKSRSPGDLEMKPEQALGFESLINDVPRAVEHIAAKIDHIETHHNSTTAQANAIETGISSVSQKLDSLPIFMATLQENHELRMQVKEYHEQIFQIKTELSTLRNQMQQNGMNHETRIPSTDRKWGIENGYF